MTPEYASPEQVRGEPATTAGDLYQLGLILYELLYGQRAQELRDASLTEIERVVREQAAAAQHRGGCAARIGGGSAAAGACAATSTTSCSRRSEGAGGSLPSVTALIEDLERHLDGRPS
jgi:serine/threonine protein kinase